MGEVTGMELKITIPGRPITKKNGSVILYNRKTKKLFVRPSDQFLKYQEGAGWRLKGKGKKLDGRYNLKCVYYMNTRQRVDLCNLMAATCDILVHYGVLTDDNSDIVVSHDGSRVLYDKDNPRAEITITELEGMKC